MSDLVLLSRALTMPISASVLFIDAFLVEPSADAGDAAFRGAALILVNPPPEPAP